MKNPNLLEAGKPKETGYGNKVYSSFGLAASIVYRSLTGPEQELNLGNNGEQDAQLSASKKLQKRKEEFKGNRPRRN